MSRFNSAVQPQKIENLAGGQAFAQSPELELVSLMLTSFVAQQFYRSTDDTLGRLKQLLPLVNVEFAAKLGIYAR